MDKKESLTKTLEYVFTSPAEIDRNWETANIVDAIFCLARAIDKLANTTKTNKE